MDDRTDGVPPSSEGLGRAAEEPESYPKPSARPRRRRGKAGRLAAGLLACVALQACQTAPVTGRSSFNLFSLDDEIALGSEAYGGILEGQERVASGPQKELVERVMHRLVAVADDPGYEWDVVLIDDDATANAFALPGGKMAVYTGILGVTQSEAGLAVVMGHEIGHVVARHGTQRMTQALGFEVIFSALDQGQVTDLARSFTDLVFGLPFSRSHESEADHIGLIYMARAGYDPREATRFWERMSALGGDAGPEVLSTHPSDETRISKLNELLPEALDEWKANGGAEARP